MSRRSVHNDLGTSGETTGETTYGRESPEGGRVTRVRKDRLLGTCRRDWQGQNKLPGT